MEGEGGCVRDVRKGTYVRQTGEGGVKYGGLWKEK